MMQAANLFTRFASLMGLLMGTFYAMPGVRTKPSAFAQEWLSWELAFGEPGWVTARKGPDLQETSTPVGTPSLTPTETLVPLPEVTMIYPTAMQTSSPLLEETTALEPLGEAVSSREAVVKSLAALVVILWFLLGGWLYLLLRKWGVW